MSLGPRVKSYVARHVAPIPQRRASILDVGAADLMVDGIRAWFESRGFAYTGVDIEARPGVDRVVPPTCVWDLGERFDYVVCLNTLEHVDKPWLLVPTMGKHLAPGGTLLIVAPFSFQHHRHPVDCFRYAPDGIAALAKEAGLQVVESYLDYESSNWYGAASDFCWYIKTGELRNAVKKLVEAYKRPHAINCVAVLKRQ